MAEKKPKGSRRVCSKGHIYYKSSDCPVCPVCEKEKKEEGFISALAAPARRALENAGIYTIEQLSRRTEKEVLKLHGMGPASMPALRSALRSNKLAFKK